MPETSATMTVRPVNPTTCVIDIQGDISAFAESALMAAYDEAYTPALRVVILNFTNMEYMNSRGIGLLVTLLSRINRQKQRLFAYGLSEHYQRIFQLTRLDEVIALFDSESAALAAVG